MLDERSKPFVFASIALAILSLVVDASAQVERKTLVLAIGVSKYPRLPGGQQLQFADRDAEDFAVVIKRHGADAANVRLLTAQEATLAGIKSAIGNWIARAATENDDVVIFFSGHGLFEPQYNESYLLAYDSDANNPYATAISVTELANALTRRVRARRVVILADAVRRDLFPPDTDGPAAATSFTKSFDALVSARPGLSVLLASGPGEFSREGARWVGHGVFTRFLLDAMAGIGDADSNGSITVEEIYNFVSKRVAEDTANKQHVWRAQTQVSEIVLARSQQIARAPTPQTATPPNRLPEPVKQPADPTVAQVPPATKPQQQTPIMQRPEGTTTPPPKSEPPKSESPKSESPKSESTKPEPRSVQPQPANKPTETTNRKPEPKTESAPARKVETENKPPAPKTENKPPAEKRTTETVSAPPSKPVTPPAAKPVNTKPPETTSAAPEANASVKTETLPQPPRPAIQPPRVSVTASAPKNQPDPTPSSVPVAPTVAAPTAAAPSPLTLQMEAAIGEGALLEPRGASAWDIYQRLASESGAAADVARLKIKLADALERAGREIVSGDVRADNIADKVDEFKRAGQLLQRARSLRPENAAIVILEKVSAAQALVALQFYDEAERALASLQDGKIAGVENALGLVYHGKLDNYRAERAFKRAIDIDPSWAAPHYNLALVYRSQKNDAALDEFAAAARLAPQSVEMATALGDEYFNREQWQKAADAFRKAIEIKPTDDSLHTKLGHALYSLGLKDEANLEYKKANELRRKQ